MSILNLVSLYTKLNIVSRGEGGGGMRRDSQDVVVEKRYRRFKVKFLSVTGPKSLFASLEIKTGSKTM